MDQFDGDSRKETRGRPENDDFGQNLRRIGPGQAGSGRAGSGPIDLIVLAGGRGSRLGGAVKPAVEIAGRTLLSRVLDARVLARRVVVVGPEAARAAAGADAPGLLWALENPPFGGPVAGIAAGLAALAGTGAEAGTADPAPEACSPEPAGWLLVLACDLPWAADAASALVAALAADPERTNALDGLHLSDPDGHAQWLAGIYRAGALREAAGRLGRAVNGASMRDLLSGFTLAAILDASGSGRDVDTWQDVEWSTTLLTTPAPPPPRSETE